LIKDKLREAAKSIGIEKIGITKDENLTVVVALFPYFVAGEQGNIAMYARARDYHKVNSEKLGVLCRLLKENGANTCKIFVDNAARNDREAARLAGIGFYGRNNLLTCDEYGSYFTIGQIVTDLDIESDLPNEQTCKNCGKCEKVCPTGALYGKKYDKSLCLSEISQKKSELSMQEAKLLKSAETIWGCDKCLSICSHNKNLITTAPIELMQNRIANIDLSNIENINDAEFRKKYAQYAFSWGGVDVLRRNLMLQNCNN